MLPAPVLSLAKAHSKASWYPRGEGQPEVVLVQPQQDPHLCMTAAQSL